MAVKKDDTQDGGAGGGNEPELNADGTPKTPPTKKDEEEVELTLEEKIAAGVDAALKTVKDNLNKAYQERDDAKKAAKILADEKRARELADLEAQGKHKEAADARVAEEKRLREEAEQREAAANQRVIELTRDNEVRTALATLPFKTGRALENAYREIVAELVQNDKGVWVHKSGASIGEAVKVYHADKDNDYLFKPKQSSGGGSGQGKGNEGTQSEVKSVFALSGDEMLKRAAEGTLPHQQRRKR